MSHRLLRGTVAAFVMLALTGGVLVKPSYSDEGAEPKIPAPGSYAAVEGVSVDGPDENFFSTIKLEDLPEKVGQLRSARGPAMLEVMVQKGARTDLGRPKSSPVENKTAFTEFLT